MKVATFNINDINRRLPNLLRWLKEAKPEVVCLQELNCTDDAFPAEALAKAREFRRSCPVAGLARHILSLTLS